MKKLLLSLFIAIAFACLFVGNVEAQLTKLCITTNGSNCVQITSTFPLPVTGTITASSVLSGTQSNAGSAIATSADNIKSVSWLYGFNGATWDQLQVDASKYLKVNCTAGCSGGAQSNATSGLATSADNGKSVSWLYGFNGATWDQLQVDGSKFLKVIAQTGSTTAVTGTVTITSSTMPISGTVAATQSGTWNIGTLNSITNTVTVSPATVTPVSGTFWQATQPVSIAGTVTITSSTMPVSGTVAATQSGTWNIGTVTTLTSITNTVAVSASTITPVSAASLPLPTLAATSTKQSDGSQKTQIVDGSGNVIASTSNNLNVQCANCSGSGVSTVDEATFTAGTSLFAGTGGFFQTTATSNALTNGQQGMLQLTANRAAFVNFRNASGTEIGTSTTPVQVSLANTGSNATALLVTGTGGTFPVTGTFWQATQPISIASAQVASGAIASGAYASGAVASGAYASGSLASGAVVDLTNLSTPITPATATATKGILLGGQYNSTQATFTNGQQGSVQLTSRGALMVATGADSFTVTATNLSTNVAQLAGTTTDTNSGTKSAGTLRVVIATDQPQLTNKLLVTPDANSAVNVAQINGVTPLMGNGVTGTGSQRVTLASDGTAISTAGYMSVKLDQTTPGTTNAVSLAQIGGTTIVNGGVAGSQSVGGTVATNVAITANPLNLGAQAVSSENTAVTTARQVQLVADLVGKLIVLPYSNPENFVSGVITSAMTGTTTTSLIAAPAAGLRNYITACTFSNAHATVGTDIVIQDGSGGTTIWNVPAAAVYGGAHITFPTPLRQPTTATAIFVANVTTGASTKAACSGYKGA